MTEMIDRAARGIYAENGWWRIVKDGDDGKGRYRDSGEHRMRAVEYEDLAEDERVDLMKSARAAIEALLEPTEAMLKAGSSEIDPHPYGVISNMPLAGAVWRAQLGEALK